MSSIYNCQARGCGARATKSSDVWCPRHRRILVKAEAGLVGETEDALRLSTEWKALVRRGQDLILSADSDAQRQTEMFHGHS